MVDFQKYFSNLLEGSDIVAHSINSEGYLIHISYGWQRLLGYTPQEVIGRRSTDFLTEESKTYAVNEVLPEFFKTGSCHEIEYTFVSKRKEEIPVLLTAKSIYDGDTFIRSCAILHPVSWSNIDSAYNRIEDWKRKQSPDIQVILKNLDIESLETDVVIQCPSTEWFGIIKAIQDQFTGARRLTLRVVSDPTQTEIIQISE